MKGICGTCGGNAEATAENEGYSYCCNDRIEYGDEAAETVERVKREAAETTTRLSNGWTLTEVAPPDGLIIKVHPETVPTTASPYHASATHVDALGMPVAFNRPFGDEAPWPYHPTPCCGASASISDPEYGMYCKKCYEQVDPAFGNHPVEPYRPIKEVTPVTTVTQAPKRATKQAKQAKPLTTMQAVQQVLKRAKGPMTAKQVAAKVVPMVPGLKGKTPEATVAAKLYVEAKKPDGILRKVEGGFVAR